MHAGIIGEIFFKVVGLGTTIWGLTHITWYFPMLRTSSEGLE